MAHPEGKTDLAQERLEARIYGQVQGVGFRYYARTMARHLNLQGYVRNREDRSVEVVAEGEKRALDQFLAQLKRGPSAATVDRVDAKWLPSRHAFRGFEVRF
jgi:acylphosphatase